MIELDGDEERISSQGRYAERDIVQVPAWLTDRSAECPEKCGDLWLMRKDQAPCFSFCSLPAGSFLWALFTFSSVFFILCFFSLSHFLSFPSNYFSIFIIITCLCFLLLILPMSYFLVPLLSFFRCPHLLALRFLASTPLISFSPALISFPVSSPCAFLSSVCLSHLASSPLYSLFLLETTLIAVATTFLAWLAWLRKCSLKYQTSSCLTWEPEGSNQGPCHLLTLLVHLQLSTPSSRDG